MPRSMKVTSGTKQASIEAVVIRADGTRENLGIVSFWHRNPIKRLMWRLGLWRPS